MENATLEDVLNSYKIKYNAVLQRLKELDEGFGSPATPLDKRKEMVGEYKCLNAKSIELMKNIKACGHEMAWEEIYGGFRK